ncbi:MAG TPA: hypothetical protein VI818_07435 [Candidatus Thermoplasmatota archaeon]|nr:hypothetical protein [Candidatus Thermoplasmatota archaeon]
MTLSGSPVFAVVALVALSATALALGSQQPKADGFKSPNLAQNQNWDLRIPTVGTYLYHCTPHPAMQGTIEVAADATTTDRATVEAVGFKFVPDAIRVAPNTSITFTNKDNTIHTVTEGTLATTKNSGSPGPGLLTLLACVALATLAGRKTD